MDFLERFAPGEIIGLTAVVSTGILIAISIISGSINEYRERTQNYELKRDLIQRGFSPDEIIRICQGKVGVGGLKSEAASDPILELSSLLASNDEKPEVMRRIMSLVTNLPNSARHSVQQAIARLVDEGVSGETLYVSVEAFVQNIPGYRKVSRDTDHEIRLEMRNV